MPTGLKRNSISPLIITLSVLIIGLGATIYTILYSTWDIFVYTCFFPFFLVTIVQAFRHPFVGLCSLFTFNYFFIPWMRYTQGRGLSIWYDAAIILLLIILLIFSYQQGKVLWKYTKNVLTIGGFIWASYTVLEIINPTAITEAWIYARGTIYSTLFISIIGVLIITSYKRLRIIIYFLSAFTLIAIFKAIYQKNIGFDAIETEMLIETEAYKTHLLPDITRYFSIFTDAGNFGSNMGFAAILFGISAIYIKGRGIRAYFIIVSLCATYALFISGTRGALFVPIAGVILFAFLSKNLKLMTVTTVFGLCVYIFFAHTYIGQGNTQIRRMRTAFKPTKDASYLVRQENKRKLAVYLKYRPFGEGLGLGGVEAQKYGERLTTRIPHDSAYVKLWMETGIVGLVLFLTIYIGTLLRGCYLIIFRIKNNELRGVLTAIACGVFGLLVSAYGNAFLTQFPTGLMVILFLSVLVNGEHIDRALTKQLNAPETIENK